MQANPAKLLDALGIGGRQFVVPIYQRVYSWRPSDVRRLWEDVLRAGATSATANHFTGSIVYIGKGQGTRTSTEPDLLIDGQQRVTTVSLLLLALADHLGTLPEDQREPADGFTSQEIRANYLTNPLKDGERFFKLVLSKADNETLKALIKGAPLAPGRSRIRDTYEFFSVKLRDAGVNLENVCTGLTKLEVVDIELARGVDDPQLVFESMNATGKPLEQNDLVRNYVLMDLEQEAQRELYESYWRPMEELFSGDDEWWFGEFVRSYLTLKTGGVPRLGDIYEAFKAYTRSLDANWRASHAAELHEHATWFAHMVLGTEPNEQLRRLFGELRQLQDTIFYPLGLRLYAEYQKDENALSREDFISILQAVRSYLLRRSICRIPTNVLNKTFAALAVVTSDAPITDEVVGRLLAYGGSQEFPSDEEFAEALRTGNIYKLGRKSYFLHEMENHIETGNGLKRRKEEVQTQGFTVEHVMPQNENLSPWWKNALGDNWREDHQRLLHTLGNLTLTGYNPEYSDKDFPDKRDMDGGFKVSPLLLNQGLAELDTWNAALIEERAQKLAAKALQLWPRPQLSDEVADAYRTQVAVGRGFDWSLLHQILEVLPPGRWTGYYYLAEIVGTASQPLANHVSKCTECKHAYRVMTYDGRIAEGFKWGANSEHAGKDPVDVLAEEGLQFINGKADPAQKMQTDELVALVDRPIE